MAPPVGCRSETLVVYAIRRVEDPRFRHAKPQIIVAIVPPDRQKSGVLLQQQGVQAAFPGGARSQSIGLAANDAGDAQSPTGPQGLQRHLRAPTVHEHGVVSALAKDLTDLWRIATGEFRQRRMLRAILQYAAGIAVEQWQVPGERDTELPALLDRVGNHREIDLQVDAFARRETPQPGHLILDGMGGDHRDTHQTILRKASAKRFFPGRQTMKGRSTSR